MDAHSQFAVQDASGPQERNTRKANKSKNKKLKSKSGFVAPGSALPVGQATSTAIVPAVIHALQQNERIRMIKLTGNWSLTFAVNNIRPLFVAAEVMDRVLLEQAPPDAGKAKRAFGK